MTDRDFLAAEHALGLLDGEALLEARGLMTSDAAFAALVGDWQEKLAPLFDEISEVRPSDALLEKIRAEIVRDAPRGELVMLKRRVGMWQGATAAVSAIAASLLLLVATDVGRSPPIAPPVSEPRPAPMVAALMDKDHAMLASAAWRADEGSLMVMPGKMPPAPGRSHQLWIIPADGTPRSIGMMTGGGMHRMAVPAALRGYFADKAMLAISVEPEGGSPGPLPTGPVIASGALATV